MLGFEFLGDVHVRPPSKDTLSPVRPPDHTMVLTVGVAIDPALPNWGGSPWVHVHDRPLSADTKRSLPTQPPPAPPVHIKKRCCPSSAVSGPRGSVPLPMYLRGA